MGGGQDAQATVSSPPGVKLIRVGVKIPWEILTPGGQAAHRYLDPHGSSCPGVKINRYTGFNPGPRYTKVVKMVLAWHSDLRGMARTDRPSSRIM